MHSPAETAALTGFSLDTMRYYERIGLLAPVDRAVSGQRRYTDDDIDWLGILGCLRGTGMPIARMLEFAEQVRAGDHTIPERIALLNEHDLAVEAEMARLAEKRDRIREKVAWYQRHMVFASAEPEQAPNDADLVIDG